MSNKVTSGVVLQSPQGLSLQEIADCLCLSRERIRQIETTAMKKMRNFIVRNHKTRMSIISVFEGVIEVEDSKWENNENTASYEFEDPAICEAENVHIILAEFDDLFNGRAK